MRKLIPRGLKKRLFVFGWQRATKLDAAGETERALASYLRLEPEKSYQSVYLARIGGCYYRMGMYLESEKFFRDSRESEEGWQGKRKMENGLYIIRYCNYFLAAIRLVEGADAAKTELLDAFGKLKATAATNSLKFRSLPIPLDSDFQGIVPNPLN